MVSFQLPLQGRTTTAAGRIDRLQTGRIGTAAFSSRGGARTATGAPPRTSLGGHVPTSIRDIREGDYTKVIYTLIKNAKLPEAIRVLKSLLDDFPQSRPLFSLLGYCYYQSQLFDDAANCYETLSRTHPSVTAYKLYYAQCLQKLGDEEGALQACQVITDRHYAPQTLQLRASIKYNTGDLEGCKMLIEEETSFLGQSTSFDQDVPAEAEDQLVNLACLLYKEGKVKEALEKYLQVLKVYDFRPDVTYYAALCHYNVRHFDSALALLDQVINEAHAEYPEFKSDAAITAEDDQQQSVFVENSHTLHKTFLCEAYNLKICIYFAQKNYKGAKQAYDQMPPRLPEHLDAVTLHNSALLNADSEGGISIEKLKVLLDMGAGPLETFSNLLMLYLRFGYYDLAADEQAAYLASGLIAPDQSGLDEYTSELMTALCLREASAEEAANRLDELAAGLIKTMRDARKTIETSQKDGQTMLDPHFEEEYIQQYESSLEAYIPVLMQQAKLKWDQKDFAGVEQLFRKSVDWCKDNETWRMNVAHTLFMQENKYQDAVSFYESFLSQHSGTLLDLPAIIIANLCVSYIMISENGKAEDIMRQVEEEEEALRKKDENARAYHLCIINLVIGTLYCAKGNYEFGIQRVMTSMEPFHRKLGTDTWFYAKRCLVALLETLAKQMILLSDTVLADIFTFLDQCDRFGANIPAVEDSGGLGLINGELIDRIKNTVKYEARRIKYEFIKLDLGDF